MIETRSLARTPEEPWRNGGGSTRELLAWPGREDWQLRISVADIREDGPFSAFPGVQRWFAVLAGDGVVLRRDGESALLTPESGPLAFEGGQPPECELLGGPTQDLNLMIRHDAGSGRMDRVESDAEWFSTAPLRALYSVGPALLQIDDADVARLGPGALAFSDHAMRQRWRVQLQDPEAPAWWLHFTPHPA